MKIDPAEYRQRQRNLAGRLEVGGYSGAIIFSRGGFTFDRAGAVLYLTGHYQPYVYLPERPPHWSGRSHTACVIDTDANVILCVSTPDVDRTEVTANDIRCGSRFADVVAGALAAADLTGGGIALIGGDCLPVTLWNEIHELHPNLETTCADECLDCLRRIKSPAEQAIIRRAVAINTQAMRAFCGRATVDARESEAVAAAVQVAVAEGAGLYFAAASSGSNIGQYASSPMPGWSTRKLRNGDFVRLDLGVVSQGYYSDFGRTVIAGQGSDDQHRLLQTLHRALNATIAGIQPGASVAFVVETGDQALRDMDVALGVEPRPGQIAASYPEHWGHGLGMGWERPWMTGDETLTLESGMYLAIERTLSLEGVGTVAAEYNLLVGEDGIELLNDRLEEIP